MNPKAPHKIDWRMRVFDSLSFPTLVLDTHQIIVSANQRFLEKTGVDEQYIIGKTCREVIGEYMGDDGLTCTHESCPLEQTLESGCGRSTVRQITTRDGATRWEDRVFSPILDEDGQVIYVIESFRDVTKSIKLERAFFNIRELLDRVILSSVSGIVAADRKGRILLMNPAAETLFGYTFNPTHDLNIRDLYPGGVAQKIMKDLRSIHRGGPGKLTSTKVNIQTSSGELIPVEMTAAIIYEDDLEMATMGIYNDLRERIALDKKLKDAEAQLIQSEKMASLGRLAAGVAHEINNPLTGIVLYGNMMLEKIDADSPVRSSLGCILEDAERCKDIVQHLLTYSRQAGTSQELFTLNLLVEESLDLIRDQKLFINISIQREFSQEGMQVFADRNRMRQVVINLVLNAIDAMDKKGTLTLRAYPHQNKKHVCLEVADTGCGISEENVSRIFDPFFTTKEPGRGTGLGLSTVYGIVKDNGGEIGIKDTSTNGTTFVITLPLATQAVIGIPESIG
jgi:PAS domain S-box-containing protein